MIRLYNAAAPKPHPEPRHTRLAKGHGKEGGSPAAGASQMKEGEQI